ncbi:MAG TPA: TolC family protein [Planctomycetota bacterium]|jgi:outer membrane protein TolC
MQDNTEQPFVRAPLLLAVVCAVMTAAAGLASDTTTPSPVLEGDAQFISASAPDHVAQQDMPRPEPCVKPALSTDVAATEDTALREKTTLEAILSMAARNNPIVSAANHRWQAATHRRAQVLALPDPKIEARYFTQRVDDKWMLMLSQEVPYPGKLILGGKVANKEAEAARLRYEATVRDALSDAKESFFELYYIDRAQHVTEEIKKLYDRYAALAVGGKEPGVTKLPETFRAESQRAQLANDLILLKEIRASETERLRATIGAPKRFALGTTEDVAEPTEISETIEKLQETAEKHNQELAAAGVEVERAKYQSQLARRAPIPDLMVGGFYEHMTMGNQVGVTAGISIPLWIPKYSAMAKEAAENEKAAAADQQAQELRIRADLAKAYFSLTNSSRLVRLYRDTLIPQARQALQSAETLYRNNTASLTSVLETTATVHNFELARLRATADFYANVARIERVLGTAFQLQPAGGQGRPPYPAIEKEATK